jgi:hypothetical protein
MRNLRFIAVCSGLGLALSMGACNGDDDDTPATTNDTAQPTTTNDTADTEDTNDTVDPTVGDTDPTEGEDETGDELPEVCEPDAGDDECAACTKENCCDELAACAADEGCACVLACVAEEEDQLEAINMCLRECALDGLPAQAGPLTVCNSTSCGDVC